VLWNKSRPNEWKKAWILGQMDKKEYLKKARFLKKGEVDKSNNFTVKADCYNLKISDLYPVECLT